MMEPKRRFWKRRRLALAAPVVFLIVLVLAAECKPSWYRPVGLDELGLDRARRDAANTADWISGRVVAGQPFELELSASALNEWLIALLYHRPDWGERLKANFRDPVVSFHDGEVRMAGVVERGGWRGVATLVLRVAVSDDRQWIDVVVRRAYLGTLVIPGSWVHRLATEPLMTLIQDQNADMTDDGGTVRSVLEPMRAKDRVMGLRAKNHWVWPNGRRPIRAADVQVQHGKIRLMLEPNP